MIEIKRIENYYGRTTPVITWDVYKDGKLVISCDRKRDAISWAKTYTD